MSLLWHFILPWGHDEMQRSPAETKPATLRRPAAVQHAIIVKRSVSHKRNRGLLPKDVCCLKKFPAHCVNPWMCYLDVVFQLLPPLLHWFGPQMRVPFAREVWSLDDLPELQVTQDTTWTFKSTAIAGHGGTWPTKWLNLGTLQTSGWPVVPCCVKVLYRGIRIC